MANVNDTNNLAGRLEKVIAKIDTADVDEADREAIRDYASWKRRRADSPNTAINYIRDVTLTAERHDVPITEVDGVTEADDILDTLEASGCTAAKSINTKLCGLRDFWRWCESTDHGLDDYRWVDLVKNVKPTPKNPGPEPLDPDFVLGEDEITALREAARNNRDKALIEFLADTGARITLATQMKRGAIDTEAQPPTFRPNPRGVGQKGVPTKDYVLHESARHLRLYLAESHPDAHRDAPLFAKEHGYDADDRENSALGRRGAFGRLMVAADAAGIDRKRAHPHNLRKSAVVRMRLKHDMSWPAIQKRMEWSDKSLPAMKEIYHAIDNTEEIELVARELGYSAPDDTEAPPESVECWNCGREIDPHDSFCRGCGVEPDADPVDAQLGRALASLDADGRRELLAAVEAVTDD